jgi:hypothetical protein
VARSEVWDCGRKMWTWRRAEFRVVFSEASASASDIVPFDECWSFSDPCWS